MPPEPSSTEEHKEPEKPEEVAVSVTIASPVAEVFCSGHINCDNCQIAESGIAYLMTKGGKYGSQVSLTYLLCRCTENYLLTVLKNQSGYFSESEPHNTEPLHNELHQLITEQVGWSSWQKTLDRKHAHMTLLNELSGVVFCALLVRHSNSKKSAVDIVKSIGKGYAKLFDGSEPPDKSLTNMYSMFCRTIK
ncbi:hypothetical protein PMI27_001245 [Pseudomonas sp. GM41(2012)]|jgi:hypothetical protein|uniref:hypothetical protein n=1 Tax=Pseudomonas sp. (strain GM41(2012)) TaxID=1144708 RepID=UPI000270324C|nr:hypothetical protein [Pseudomonas sp. GM41(2012)]EUB75069.1 hypothetical protein PMI27_001245 [Pseudomonas sp. GM41(2012)]